MFLNSLEKLKLELESLVIFRPLLEDKGIKLLMNLLDQGDKSISGKISAYAAFASTLFEKSHNLADYIWDCVLSCENIYVRKYARGEKPGPVMEECLKYELEVLRQVAALPAREIKKEINYDGYLPEWESADRDFYSDYLGVLKNISRIGYGIYYKYHVFTIREGQLIPVKNPDLISLSDLKGYERQRKMVIDNTLALLEGKNAANALLYGDAGTGKSSTVKAIANEFRDRGLRLVEIRKNQILEIPGLIQRLSEIPLKFILFIDDLSFASDNEEIGVLKAILEGTAIRRSQNIVIYATSNRRHLVRETLEERMGSDIHINETIQEQVALSERFGLSVNFSKPGREEYLMIIRELARDYNVKNTDNIEAEAERFALERGGRSPRIARQFIEALKIKE